MRKILLILVAISTLAGCSKVDVEKPDYTYLYEEIAGDWYLHYTWFKRPGYIEQHNNSVPKLYHFRMDSVCVFPDDLSPDQYLLKPGQIHFMSVWSEYLIEGDSLFICYPNFENWKIRDTFSRTIIED